MKSSAGPNRGDHSGQGLSEAGCQQITCNRELANSEACHHHPTLKGREPEEKPDDAQPQIPGRSFEEQQHSVRCYAELTGPAKPTQHLQWSNRSNHWMSLQHITTSHSPAKVPRGEAERPDEQLRRARTSFGSPQRESRRRRSLCPAREGLARPHRHQK